MVSLLVFLIVLGILVVVHELGHFVIAKRSGVHVLEFGLGFPPKLLGIRRGETEYTLNAFPLGGFVKMVGEEDPNQPRSLASKPARTRLLVLSAGALMNILLAVILFSASMMIPRETVVGAVMIDAVAANSPAERAGLQQGDRIIKINDRQIENTADVGYFIRLGLGDEIAITVQRDQATQITTYLAPRWNPPAGQGPTGIQISMPDQSIQQTSSPIWEAIPGGVQRATDSLILLKNEIISWVVSRTTPQLSGPVGIYQMTGEASQAGFGYLLEFVGLLSLQLGIFNLLPFPMLDGGRIMFVLLEIVRRGKRIPAEKEALVHLLGLVFLMMMIVIVSYNDVVRILSSESVLR